MPDHRPVVGRLAPSPTGLLHVGNARSLLLAWLAARSVGGRLHLRIEDLLPDAERHLDGLLRDLLWLGLDWDPPEPGALWQPAPPRVVDGRVVQGYGQQGLRGRLYDEVLAALATAGLVYPCVCTRKDIDQAARAPHAEDKGVAYPGTCRGRFATEAEALAFEDRRALQEGRAPLGVALRLRVPDTTLRFTDLLHGERAVNPTQDSGDIVVRRKDGGHAYMLAVVVDDLAMGVTQVVRGDDLLDVTAQQLAVYAALAELGRQQAGVAGPLQALWQRARDWQPPEHAHVPLVLGDDGRRLAKRDQSLHLHSLRDDGVPPQRLRAWLAQSVGLGPLDDLAAMAEQFRWDRLPRAAVRFGAAERWAVLGTGQTVS